MPTLTEKTDALAASLGEGAKNAQLLQGALRAIPRASGSGGGGGGARASSLDLNDLVSRILGGMRNEFGDPAIRLRREGL